LGNNLAINNAIMPLGSLDSLMGNAKFVPPLNID